MLLGHPLAERGGERAKCKAEVVAGILDEGSVIFNVQSNMHNIDRNAFDIGCVALDELTCGFTLVSVRE